MFQFYKAGHANATDPFEVGHVIHDAITSPAPKLRYAVSWGAAEIIAGRRAMSDEAWVAIGAHDDDDYYAAFESAFGLDIAHV
jgi:hypothetical protein